MLYMWADRDTHIHPHKHIHAPPTAGRGQGKRQRREVVAWGPVIAAGGTDHEAQQEARDLLYGLELEPSWGEGTVTDTVFERIEDIEEQ